MADFIHTKVEPERLGETANRIDTSLRIVEKALNTLDDTLLNTLRPNWSGEASSAFFTRYSVDALEFNVFLKNLRSLNEQLSAAAGIYDKADSQAADIVKGMKMGGE